jgi:GNAT superfamily N-acetyltransferase
MVEGLILRKGGIADVPALLKLMDIATEWLVAQGRPGQWGTEIPSERPDRIAQLTGLAESGGLWVAVDESWKEPDPRPQLQSEETNGAVSTEEITRGILGGVCVGEAMPYVKPATEPELYIRFLLADRKSKRRGVGAMLLGKARDLARDAGVELLRLDCYAGDDQKLVRWYESQGFQRVEAFTIRGWPGQILTQRLEGEKSI